MDPRSFRALLFGIVAGVLAVCPVAGAEFSWQVAGSYRDDSGNTIEGNNSTVSATRYFPPVDDRDVPYELAPFLSRSSFVTIDATWQTQNLSAQPAPEEPVEEIPVPGVRPGTGALPPALGAFVSDLDIDSSEYAVSGRYVWADSGWYLGGRLDRGTVDRPRGDSLWSAVAGERVNELLGTTDWPRAESVLGPGSADTEGYGVWAGKYFGDVTAVEVRLNSNELTSVQEYSFSRLNLAFEAGTKTSTDYFGVSVRRAGLVAGRLYWLAANLGRDRSDTRLILPSITNIVPSPDVDLSTSGYRYGLTAGLYPNRAIGVRMNYTRGDDGGSLAGVSASWFFVPNAALDVGLARVELERGAYAVDVDVVTLRLLGRF